jgi:inner membrane protein involved in colicin E2 resistance
MIEQLSAAHCVALSCVFLCVDEVMFNVLDAAEYSLQKRSPSTN